MASTAMRDTSPKNTTCSLETMAVWYQSEKEKYHLFDRWPWLLSQCVISVRKRKSHCMISVRQEGLGFFRNAWYHLEKNAFCSLQGRDSFQERCAKKKKKKERKKEKKRLLYRRLTVWRDALLCSLKDHDLFHDVWYQSEKMPSVR